MMITAVSRGIAQGCIVALRCSFSHHCILGAGIISIGTQCSNSSCCCRLLVISIIVQQGRYSDERSSGNVLQWSIIRCHDFCPEWLTLHSKRHLRIIGWTEINKKYTLFIDDKE